MKSYLITVKFHTLINALPVMQTLNVCTTEPEFSVLLHALNASIDVAELQVFSKHLTSTNHPLTKMTHEDLGYINNVNMEKLV
jgi:hypothetical protein